MKQKTVSLWSYTNSQLSLYQNPLYWAVPSYQPVLMPIASMRYIKPWKSHYSRWNPSMRQQVRFLSLLRDERRTLILLFTFAVEGSRLPTNEGASSLKGAAREATRGGSPRAGFPSESVSDVASTAKDTFPCSLIARERAPQLSTNRSDCKRARRFLLSLEPEYSID